MDETTVNQATPVMSTGGWLETISHLIVLDALFNFGGRDVDENNCYKVPSGEEFGKHPLVILKTLIEFRSCTEPVIPETYMELFALIILADFLGYEDYLSTAAGWLSSPVDKVRNVNGTHKVLHFIRGWYRAPDTDGPRMQEEEQAYVTSA